MHMLNSEQLRGFEATARLGSFSRASKELGITQSALSRRIQALEQDLETTLLVRRPTGAQPTEAGLRLLNYVKTRESMEEEVRSWLSQGKEGDLSGLIRIGGYSSVLKLILLPALAPFLRKNPRSQLRLVATQGGYANRTYVSPLLRGEVDFLLHLCNELEPHRDIDSVFLGHQEVVGVESTRYQQRSTTMLDVGPSDVAAQEYFAQQQKSRIRYERSFLYDEEGIIRGVELGLGRAVVFKQLLENYPTVRIIPKSKPLRWKLYLLNVKQPFSTRLSEQVKTEIVKKIRS